MNRACWNIFYLHLLLGFDWFSCRHGFMNCFIFCCLCCLIICRRARDPVMRVRFAIIIYLVIVMGLYFIFYANDLRLVNAIYNYFYFMRKIFNKSDYTDLMRNLYSSWKDILHLLGLLNDKFWYLVGFFLWGVVISVDGLWVRRRWDVGAVCLTHLRIYKVILKIKNRCM
jgi:hypothetical protein